MIRTISQRIIMGLAICIFFLPTAVYAQYDISDAQYEQLRQALLHEKGYLSQKWGNNYSGNVTSCTNSSLANLHPGVDYSDSGQAGATVYSPVTGKVKVVQGSDCGSGSCLSTVVVYNAATNKSHIFLHMQSFAVSDGGTVQATYPIGTVGRRGASGPHLHYEVRDGNRTAAALCIDSTVNPYINTPLGGGGTANPINWEFNTNNNFENWFGTNVSGVAVNNGIFFIDPSGGDPYITSPALSINASVYRYIKVRLASNALDSYGSIYFRTSEENYYSEWKQVAFQPPVNNCSLCGNAQFYEYTIYMGNNQYWRSTITGIRVDPARNGQGGTNRDSVGFDYIRISQNP